MYYISESPVHGRGLFASRAIEAGEILGEVSGEPTTEDGPYVLWLSDEGGFEVRCDLRYINHSKQPNAIYYDDLTVVALRDIAPGEEIVHDYGDDWL